MFDGFFSHFHMKTPLGRVPEVDLQEKPGRYVVTVNAHVDDQSSVDVKLEYQVLRISIKTEHTKIETDNKNVKNQYHACFVGQFQKLLTLPCAVNADKMTSEYRNGVLTLTIPKA